MNCPTNPTVSILKEKETDSTNNRLAQLCDRENIKELDRKSTRLNSSHTDSSRMPSSA